MITKYILDFGKKLIFRLHIPRDILLECRDKVLVFYQNLRSIWLLFSIMFSLLVILRKKHGYRSEGNLGVVHLLSHKRK